MTDEYKDLSEVIDEVKLKKQHNVSIKELHDEIVNLTRLLNDMFVLFKTSAEQMRLEEKKEKSSHDSIMEKLDEIIGENKTIAESVVALADMINKQKEERPTPIPKPAAMPPRYEYASPQYSPPQEPRPMPPRPPGMPPRPFQPRQMSGFPPPSQPPMPPEMPDLDEPFPFEEKKKGLFGRIRK